MEPYRSRTNGRGADNPLETCEFDQVDAMLLDIYGQLGVERWWLESTQTSRVDLTTTMRPVPGSSEFGRAVRFGGDTEPRGEVEQRGPDFVGAAMPLRPTSVVGGRSSTRLDSHQPTHVVVHRD